jgi:integrase
MNARSFKVGLLTIRPFTKGRDDTGRWQIDIPGRFTRSGKRKREVHNCRSSAEAAARALWREIQVRGSTGAIPQSNHARLSLDDVIEQWLDYQERRVRLGKKRASTYEKNIYELKPVSRLLGRHRVCDLTAWHFEEYQANRLDEGRARRTVNCEVSALRQVLLWAAEHKSLPAPPRVEMLPLEHVDRFIATPEQVSSIIDHLCEPVSSLVLVLALTGCRWSEVRALRWEDYDAENRVFHIRENAARGLKTKQSRRSIPLPPEAIERLQGLPRVSEWIFPSPKTGRPYDTIGKTLNRAVERCGIMDGDKPAKISPQVLRRSFATWQAGRRIPEHVLQRLLGHKPGSRVTGAYYVMAQDPELQEAMQGLRLKAEMADPKAVRVRSRRRA